MRHGISRRKFVESVGAISTAALLYPAERLLAKTGALSSPPSQELVLHFRGLWAFVVGKDRITAVTARIGEHSYHANERHMDEGVYSLSGVKTGGKPHLPSELVICKVSNAGELKGRYLQMELPFPKSIEGSPCLVQAKFSGSACHTQPVQFPIAHAFHYDADPSATPQLKPWQNWPNMDSSPMVEVQIKAEPPCPVNNAKHPFDAFNRLMQLFPTVGLTLDQIRLAKGCPTPQNGSCPGANVDPDNLSNPENCVQVWVQP